MVNVSRKVFSTSALSPRHLVTSALQPTHDCINWHHISRWPVFGQILPETCIECKPQNDKMLTCERVILKVQSLWKRGLPEWEAILWATHPSTAPTKEFPDEIHVRASARDQSLGNSKITSVIYYFSASTSSTFEIHLVLEWNQNFSTASHSKTLQPRRGKTQPSAMNCKRIWTF